MGYDALVRSCALRTMARPTRLVFHRTHGHYGHILGSGGDAAHEHVVYNRLDYGVRVFGYMFSASYSSTAVSPPVFERRRYVAAVHPSVGCSTLGNVSSTHDALAFFKTPRTSLPRCYFPMLKAIAVAGAVGCLMRGVTWECSVQDRSVDPWVPSRGEGVAEHHVGR